MFKPKRSQPVKRIYNPAVMTKPSMYKRVDEEKKRIQIGKIITINHEYNLKKHYFRKLEFYHGIIQLRKRIKLSYKLWSFLILKNYYTQKKEKYNYILEHFNEIRKIRVFATLYREHIIQMKKNSLLKACLVKNFEKFINITTKNLYEKYELFKKNEKWFFKQFIKNINEQRKQFILSEMTMNNFNNLVKNRTYNDFLKQVKIIAFLKQNIISLKKTFSYMNFMARIKLIIEGKNAICRNVFGFCLKSNFQKFVKIIKEMKKIQKEKEISIMFYQENKKRKIFQILRRKNFLIQKLCYLAKSKFLLTKERKKYIIKESKIKTRNLILKYRQYKKEKIIPEKKFFLNLLVERVSYKIKNKMAKEHFIKTIEKKIYYYMTEYTIKMTNFKIFLFKFKKIYHQMLISNYLNLMKFKAHHDDNNKKLSHIVSYYLHKKLETQLVEFTYKQMQFFYKKTKKIILNKKLSTNKIVIAEELYKKKTKIKIFECFHKHHKYLLIRKKYNLYLKKKICNLLKQRKKKYISI